MGEWEIEWENESVGVRGRESIGEHGVESEGDRGRERESVGER